LWTLVLDEQREDRGPKPGARSDEAGDRWGKTTAPPRDTGGDRDGPRGGDGGGGGGGRPKLNLKARSTDAGAAGRWRLTLSNPR
jgi:hypothetical protein